MTRKIDPAALMDFVLRRRKDTGGYGATPRLPASIEDTFQAVVIGVVLGEAPPTPQSEPALAGYLARMLALPWLGIGTTFRLLMTCRICGVAIDVARVRSRLGACLDTDASLAASYYVNQIDKEIVEGRDFFGPKQAVALTGRCTVQDAARYLATKAMGKQQVGEIAGLGSWLKRSQNGDGGFGFFPGTTSFIENCHAALAALSFLGGRPLDPANAKAFVISCQTGYGGFARNPRAAPFLDASWHAIASLRLLEEMEQRPAGSPPNIASLESRLVLLV